MWKIIETAPEISISSGWGWQLNPRAEHFIGFNCREGHDADRGAVSVVPWVDAKDAALLNQRWWCWVQDIHRIAT